MSASAVPARQLWLAVYLPHFPLEAFSSGVEFPRPVVVVSDQRSRARVVTASETARARGVQAGMAVSSAMSLIPSLQVLKRDEIVEAAALDGLAAWAGQFTSFVSVMARQGLLLEVKGSVRLFGSLDALLEQVRQGLEALGYTARMAIAPSPLGAWWLAQLKTEQRMVTERAALAKHLDPVPLQLMALPKALEAMARGMGLKCFGDCCRLPREGLARRLGSELVRLLDRALGRHPDPRIPYVPPSVFERCLSLPALVWEVESLVFAVRRLLLELVGFLQARNAGVLSLDIRLVHGNAKHTCVALELSVATRDFQHLLDLLRMRLEGVKLSAAVEAVRCTARCTLPLAALPLDSALFGSADTSKEGRYLLVERLRARLGAGAVQGLRPVAEYRPERAWIYTALEKAQPSFISSRPRPLWLLEQPAMLKPVNDRLHLGGALELTTGPERLESGWWDGEDVVRDYFVAKNPHGTRFWIFRERNQPRRWFLHGLFA
jgi:protein ImuB